MTKEEADDVRREFSETAKSLVDILRGLGERDEGKLRKTGIDVIELRDKYNTGTGRLSYAARFASEFPRELQRAFDMNPTHTMQQLVHIATARVQEQLGRELFPQSNEG
jgi:phage-related protein